ncbi:MAG: hypothetical protein ACXVHR_06560, partial [Methanobacterium sp.]
NSPLFEKPTIGNNPFVPVVKEKMEDDNKLLDSVLVEILNRQGTGSYAHSSNIIRALNISPMLFKVSVIKLNNRGFTRWFSANTTVSSTEKGLMYAFENKLIS